METGRLPFITQQWIGKNNDNVGNSQNVKEKNDYELNRWKAYFHLCSHTYILFFSANPRMLVIAVLFKIAFAFLLYFLLLELLER